MARIGIYLDRGDVSVEDFTEAFDAQVRLVGQVMAEMGFPSHEVRWVVSELEYGSTIAFAVPQQLGPHIFADDIEKAVLATGRGLKHLASSSERPKYFNDEALKTGRRLVQIAVQSDNGKARLTFGSSIVAPSTHITANVDTIIKSDLASIGTIEGKLVGVTTKDGAYKIAIMDRLGRRSVPCTIPPHLLKDALGAFESRVIVRGIIRSHADGSSTRIEVRDFEVMAADESLPTAEEVRGILSDYQRADGNR